MPVTTTPGLSAQLGTSCSTTPHAPFLVRHLLQENHFDQITIRSSTSCTVFNATVTPLPALLPCAITLETPLTCRSTTCHSVAGPLKDRFPMTLFHRQTTCPFVLLAEVSAFKKCHHRNRRPRLSQPKNHVLQLLNLTLLLGT